MENLKKCKKCNRELPMNDVYFFKNKQLKDGFEGACKECRGSSFTKRKDKPVASEGFKVCSDCLAEYPNTLEYFSSDKRRKDKLSYCCKSCLNARNRKNYKSESKHEYYIKNKDYILEREKNYREANIDKFKEKDKRYYVENVDKILEYQKRYRVKNSDKIQERRKFHYNNNKELHRIRCKKYYEKNKEILNMKSKIYHINNKDSIRVKNCEYRKTEHAKRLRKINENKRRTLKKKLLSYLTKNQWDNILSKFNNSCAYCGSSEPLTIDHFVPISKGGELTVSNVIPCCCSCNSSKNNKNFFEWYSRQSFYDKERKDRILKHLKYKDRTQQISIL